MTGRSVVGLHGLRRSPEDWAGVIRALPSGWTAAVPALPADPRQALAVADEAISEGDVVFAHSMGAVVALRLLQARPRGVAALVLTGSFFPPSRNGRSARVTAADYLTHRVAYVRESLRLRSSGESSDGAARALASLARQAVRPEKAAPAWRGRPVPVLVVHARDDHHVPVDFAIAAAARHPGWTLALLGGGGHHAHVAQPEKWLAAVTAWLATTLPAG